MSAPATRPDLWDGVGRFLPAPLLHAKLVSVTAGRPDQKLSCSPGRGSSPFHARLADPRQACHCRAVRWWARLLGDAAPPRDGSQQSTPSQRVALLHGSDAPSTRRAIQSTGGRGGAGPPPPAAARAPAHCAASSSCCSTPRECRCVRRCSPPPAEAPPSSHRTSVRSRSCCSAAPVCAPAAEWPSWQSPPRRSDSREVGDVCRVARGPGGRRQGCAVLRRGGRLKGAGRWTEPRLWVAQTRMWQFGLRCRMHDCF